MGFKASPLCLRSASSAVPTSSYDRSSCSSLASGSMKVPALDQTLSLGVYPFQACKLKDQTLKFVCHASSNGLSEGNSSERFEELAQQLHMSKEDIEINKSNEPGVSEISFMPFSRSKMDILEPALLGIWPEPPEWPERDEIRRVSIELKANSVALPISLRMLKKKYQLEERFKEAGDVTDCSATKSFSSLVFIIQEIQKYALNVRGGMPCEDFQDATAKLHRETNGPLVWLFQQVFSQTPTLMVNIMTLLANSMVSSVAANIAAFAVGDENSHIDSSLIGVSDSESTNETVKTNSSEGDYNASLSSVESGDLTKEETNMWNLMVEEVSNLRHGIFRTKLQLVSPFNTVLERDDYDEFFRTDLLYQMLLSQDPHNTLLQSNYAQFLWLVAHDYERAEEFFRRAIAVESPDPEAFSCYADFLWNVRKDLWNAEERYQQALAADPENPYHGSKYANFLWSTGGDETCYPPSAASSKVL